MSSAVAVETVADEAARLGRPPRRARLHRKFHVVRWVLALAVLLPPSCVWSLGRGEAAQLERLARDGVVARAHVTGKQVARGRGATYRISAAFDVGGSTFAASDTVPEERFVATPVGAPVEVTYLPEDPATNRIDRVDGARVARHTAAFTWSAVALAAAFGFVCWMFERHTRRALGLLRDGHAAVATVVERPRRRGRLRGRVPRAHYVFRAPDGAEHTGRSAFRDADDLLAPGTDAVVLFDPRRPQRSELLASLEQLATVRAAASPQER